MAGVEYGNGIADAVPGAARLAQNGLEASLGYASAAAPASARGWQHLVYARAQRYILQWRCRSSSWMRFTCT